MTVSTAMKTFHVQIGDVSVTMLGPRRWRSTIAGACIEGTFGEVSARVKATQSDAAQSMAALLAGVLSSGAVLR